MKPYVLGIVFFGGILMSASPIPADRTDLRAAMAAENMVMSAGSRDECCREGLAGDSASAEAEVALSPEPPPFAITVAGILLLGIAGYAGGRGSQRRIPKS